MPAESFGGRLALLRQRLGLNVKQAAEAAHLPVQSWRQWEHGVKPRGMDTIARQIADAFSLDYVWLMTGEVSPNAIRTCLLGTPSVEGPEQLQLPLEPS